MSDAFSISERKCSSLWRSAASVAARSIAVARTFAMACRKCVSWLVNSRRGAPGARLRTDLQYAAEPGRERPSGEPDGGVHQVPDRGAGEGLLPHVRHGLLLARGRLQRGVGALEPGVARLAFGTQQSEPRGVHWGVTTLHSAVVFSTLRSTGGWCAASRRGSQSTVTQGIAGGFANSSKT